MAHGGERRGRRRRIGTRAKNVVFLGRVSVLGRRPLGFKRSRPPGRKSGRKERRRRRSGPHSLGEKPWVQSLAHWRLQLHRNARQLRRQRRPTDSQSGRRCLLACSPNHRGQGSRAWPRGRAHRRCIPKRKLVGRARGTRAPVGATGALQIGRRWGRHGPQAAAGGPAVNSTTAKGYVAT